MSFKEFGTGELGTIATAKLLIVDDDVPLVQMLREALEASGYEVIRGYDGQAALKLALEQRPDLIILDINMPMTNGIKAFNYLRSNESTRPIPVIFLSGELSRDVYPIIEQASRVAHLKKPIDLEHLNSVVREFLTRYPVIR